MSFQLQLVIPLDPVDLLPGWKVLPPPLFPEHRVCRYAAVLFPDRCNNEYSTELYHLFFYHFMGLTLRLTGSRTYRRSGGAAGYPVFEVNSPSIYRWIIPEMRV